MEYFHLSLLVRRDWARLKDFGGVSEERATLMISEGKSTPDAAQAAAQSSTAKGWLRAAVVRRYSSDLLAHPAQYNE